MAQPSWDNLLPISGGHARISENCPECPIGNNVYRIVYKAIFESTCKHVSEFFFYRFIRSVQVLHRAHLDIFSWTISNAVYDHFVNKNHQLA